MNYLDYIKQIIKEYYYTRFTSDGWSKQFGFYAYRIMKCYKYGLVQGRELLKMICRAAFNDESLSEAEAVVIIEACHDPRIDNLLLEVNYNEGW